MVAGREDPQLESFDLPMKSVIWTFLRHERLIMVNEDWFVEEMDEF